MPRTLPPNQRYITIEEFTLESGETLVNATVAFTFLGLLNAARDNAILICHALSGSADVAEWWSSLLTQASPALDPAKWCIICCNSLGSPYGSAGPLTYHEGGNGEGKKIYGPDFPKTTIRDDVR
jgi:homoserine O-acetyltransferase